MTFALFRSLPGSIQCIAMYACVSCCVSFHYWIYSQLSHLSINHAFLLSSNCLRIAFSTFVLVDFTRIVSIDNVQRDDFLEALNPFLSREYEKSFKHFSISINSAVFIQLKCCMTERCNWICYCRNAPIHSNAFTFVFSRMFSARYSLLLLICCIFYSVV